MVISVSMSGSGTIGHIQQSWEIVEQCTPGSLGDSSGSTGSLSLTARAKSDSRYVADNQITVDHPTLGTWRGRVLSSPVQGLAVDVQASGPLGFLVADRTMPPVWFDNTADGIDFAAYGSSAGQVGTAYGIAVDPVDGGVWVTSTGTVSGSDRFKAIKYTSAGVYVTEIGSSGTGNGQFGSSGLFVAVSPVDQAVIVSDAGNYRIQKFTTADGGLTYSYSTKVGAVGSGNGQFGSTSPIPIAVDSTGKVYAGDRGNSRIQKFSATLTYSAQVAVSGFDTGGVGVPIFDLTIDGSDVIYASLITTVGLAAAPGTIRSYNTSLVAQATITPVVPTGTSTGILNISAVSDGIWAHWGLGTYLVKYDSSGVEIARWVSAYPAPTTIQTNYNLAANRTTGTVYVLFRPADPSTGFGSPYAGNSVTAFNYEPVPLSGAILRYMEACDANLGGLTFSYDAAVDPLVVFPGWQGSVWTKLKELFAAYQIEPVVDGSAIHIYDIGSRTTTIGNRTTPRTVPSNIFGGQFVDINYLSPVAGGGEMYNDPDTVWSVDVGEVAFRTVSTDNYPTELADPQPTDVLPINPGQYYVIDATGTHVPVASWTGSVRAEPDASPGLIDLTFIGPPSAISGYTGPFSFATSGTSDGVGALSVTGPGVQTVPGTLRRSTGADPSTTTQEVAFTVPGTFIDTLERAYDVGGWSVSEASGPNVEISFDVPTSSVSFATVGKVFTFEGSSYRITECRYGNVKTSITARRRVTLGAVDTVWSGQTLGDYDAFWDGYSAGDQRIQPLLISR